MGTIVSASESAYAQLLDLIVSGKLAAGEKLREEALCRELEVSRTPLREALLKLERDGLVERRPRYGCMVRKVCPREIGQLFECRAILECQALELGFDSIPSSEVREIREMLSRNKSGSRQESRMAIEADNAMHAMIISCCPNSVLAEIILDLNRRCSPFRDTRSYSQSSLPVVNAEREGILDAIEEKDLPRALRCLREHIIKGGEVLRDMSGSV